MKLNAQKITLLTAVLIALALVGFVAFQQFGGAGPSGFELERQPALGEANAPVEIVVFEDFKCPACRSFEEQVFPRIVRNFVESGQARAYFINFQFLAPDSTTAGIAGECAYRQNEAAFWNYKTYVYRSQGPQNQTWATPARLTEIARMYVPELDADELRSCIDERRYEDEVIRDRQIANRMGVNSTPTVFVNGTRVETPTFEAIAGAVEAQLAQADVR